MLTSRGPFRSGRVARPIFLLLALAGWTSWTSAAEPLIVEQQSRAFKISVDGTERGTLTMSLARRNDGTETMRGEAELLFNFVVYKYRYSSVGTETWKDGRLIRLANEADYNGDKYVVQAAATSQALEYEVNGESQRTAADVWVTSYWCEPAADKIGRKLNLFDSDKGRQRTGTLQRIGPEKLIVATLPVTATHYRIRGDVDVDLWYDDEGRLVRQTSLESGHRTLLELTKIRR